MKYMKIRPLKDFGPHIAGKIVNVQSDENGVPLDAYWRRRIQDSAIDGCCEVVNLQADSKKMKSGKK